jgi:hypothetical protein
MQPLFIILLPLLITLNLRLSAQTGVPKGDDELSTPHYGLDKVQAAINKVVHQDYKPQGFFALTNSQYASLTLDEKFTYNMIHAEWYSQMCDMMPLFLYRDSIAWRIFPQLPRFFGEYSWSNRQRDFFKNNRDSVIRLIKETIIHDGTAGLNLLTVIVDLNAKELTPLLIDTYRRYHSNHYILTTLMILMKNNRYAEFFRSPQYAQLYDLTSSGAHTDYLPYTTKNIEFILQQATKFYHDTVRQ